MEKAALLALIEVESAGKVYAFVNGRPEPLSRFDGHQFDQRLKNGKRDTARRAGRAAAIDRQAAYESVSGGVGQVMGAHWDGLDFKSVDALLALCRKDAAGQIELMVKFIVKAGLVDELQRRDFTGFARG